jgi:hypothetical protein
MKKLKLEPDELSVESFAPGADTEVDGGTVHGREMVMTRSCPSHDVCLTPWCPTNSTTLCRC